MIQASQSDQHELRGTDLLVNVVTSVSQVPKPHKSELLFIQDLMSEVNGKPTLWPIPANLCSHLGIEFGEFCMCNFTMCTWYSCY